MDTKKIKVLHILAEIKYSGAEVMLRLAGNYLTEKNTALYALSTGDKMGDFAPILEESQYQVHHIRFSYSLSFIITFFKFLRQHQFDVAHIHREGGRLAIAFICKMAGVRKIVATVHNVFGILFTGRRRIQKIIERWIQRNILGVVFISIGESVANTERKYLKNTTVLIPNWIDAHLFQPATSQEEVRQARQKMGIGEELVITTVGSFINAKGHIDALKAVCLLKEKIDKKFVLLLVGGGYLKESYQQYIEENGIGEYVRFMGQIKNVREILIASDVYVMTSKFEGLPISLLEALHCGIPAVVYNNYGLVDLVKDRTNGFVVAADARLLAEKILLFLDKNLQTRLGANASSIVRQEYSMEKSLDSHLALYGSN